MHAKPMWASLSTPSESRQIQTGAEMENTKRVGTTGTVKAYGQKNEYPHGPEYGEGNGCMRAESFPERMM